MKISNIVMYGVLALSSAAYAAPAPVVFGMAPKEVEEYHFTLPTAPSLQSTAPLHEATALPTDYLPIDLDLKDQLNNSYVALDEARQELALFRLKNNLSPSQSPTDATLRDEHNRLSLAVSNCENTVGQHQDQASKAAKESNTTAWARGAMKDQSNITVAGFHGTAFRITRDPKQTLEWTLRGLVENQEVALLTIKRTSKGRVMLSGDCSALDTAITKARNTAHPSYNAETERAAYRGNFLQQLGAFLYLAEAGKNKKKSPAQNLFEKLNGVSADDQASIIAGYKAHQLAI